jgi:hypothetical protein
MLARRSALPAGSPRCRFIVVLLPALAACATGSGATSSATPSAGAGTVGCGASRLDAIEVGELVKRLATSTESGPTKMRAGVGLSAPVLTPTDTVRFSDDPAVCRQAATAYARTFGAAPAGRGVLVTRFGPHWLIARPDGRPRPFAMVADSAFQQRAVWGL